MKLAAACEMLIVPMASSTSDNDSRARAVDFAAGARNANRHADFGAAYACSADSEIKTRARIIKSEMRFAPSSKALN